MAAKSKSKKKTELTEAELLSPLPALSLPKKEEVVFPNADNTLAAQKEFLELRLAAVLGMEMNEANLEKVKTVKKGIVGWRNTFKKQCDDYVKGVYKGPMEVFKTAADAVMDDIAKMEAQCDEILDKEEEKRRAQVNAAIDGLIEDLKDEFGFEFEVERKKEYYNKTADMKAVAQDLREQYQAEASARKQKEADIKLIEKACGGEFADFINPKTYTDMLVYEPASVVYEKVEAEKERLRAKFAEKAAASPAPAEVQEEPVQIGIKVNKEAMKSDFPGLNKKMTLQLEYPVDLGDELTRIFDELRKNGVKMKVLKVEEPDMPKF
jgi:hypothetical protein